LRNFEELCEELFQNQEHYQKEKFIKKFLKSAPKVPQKFFKLIPLIFVVFFGKIKPPQRINYAIFGICSSPSVAATFWLFDPLGIHVNSVYVSPWEFQRQSMP